MIIIERKQKCHSHFYYTEVKIQFPAKDHSRQEKFAFFFSFILFGDVLLLVLLNIRNCKQKTILIHKTPMQYFKSKTI